MNFLLNNKLNFGDNSTSGKSRPCEKLLHAIRIWSLEPASTAYAKSIKGKYKDRTLDDWYNYMRSNEWIIKSTIFDQKCMLEQMNSLHNKYTSGQLWPIEAFLAEEYMTKSLQVRANWCRNFFRNDLCIRNDSTKIEIWW